MTAYVLCVVVVAPRVAVWLTEWLKLHPRWRLGLALGTSLLALSATAFIYPAVDSGRFGFYSDRDEALDVGARHLLAGDNPYRCLVVSGEHRLCLDQGNPIGPLPGGLLLAAPFVLLVGASAFQTVFWLALAWAGALRRVVAPHAAVAVATTALAIAPIAAAELLTGGDLLANALAVSLLGVAWIGRGRPDWIAFALALLLGVAFAWRSHFLLAAPVLAVFLMRRWGVIPALWQVGAMAAVFLTLSLPFYLIAPNDFGPLLVQQKLRLAGGDIGQALALSVSAVVALSAAWFARSRFVTLLGCAVAVLMPSLFAVAFESWAQGRFAPAFYGWYALSGSVFAALAAIEGLAPQAHSSQPTGADSFDPIASAR